LAVSYDCAGLDKERSLKGEGYTQHERKIKYWMRGCSWPEGVSLDNLNDGMADAVEKVEGHYEDLVAGLLNKSTIPQ